MVNMTLDVQIRQQGTLNKCDEGGDYDGDKCDYDDGGGSTSTLNAIQSTLNSKQTQPNPL